MKKQFIRQALIWLCVTALCVSLLPAAALAVQDFYGEGNVLIAVDMGPYAENDEVSYPEGTLGTLQWGPDAPTGESTRDAFRPRAFAVPDDVTLPRAPDYAMETVYTVGQRVFFPFFGSDELSDEDLQWFSADALPPELFDAHGAPRFLLRREHIRTENGVTQYRLPFEAAEDGTAQPCVDFLEIECAAVTAHSTVWQYTGAAFSTRADFDPAVYVGAVELTAAELQYFIETCDESYTKQGEIYGDPRWEDRYGDCDGKAAYVALDLSIAYPTARAFYSRSFTDWAGFDCLVMGANALPGRSANAAQAEEDFFTGTLIHELNHYIVSGCIGHEEDRWGVWVGEAFAQSAIHAVRPESVAFRYYRPHLTDHCARLRTIPGMLWDYGGGDEYPAYNYIAYTLGPYFLRYIERETTGQADGRLWTHYFAQRTPVGSITGAELDGYLTETTGAGLDAWLAQFMAAAVVGADSGAYCMDDGPAAAEYRLDPFIFYRPREEYGTGLSFDGVADDSIGDFLAFTYGFTGASGGGTTYAWRSDAGGPIAVTGADERWHFFAADIDLPAEKAIVDIGSAAELAKIGHDPAYPLSGRYRLTADIDLGGSEAAPWLPIGSDLDPFIGEFDGNGHTVRGLYINAPAANRQGLFGRLSGNAEVRDLTVYGSVTGGQALGGIVGYLLGGTIRGCKSLVTVTGTQSCGGVAGAIWHGTVADCTAAGAVTGTQSCGGIAGFGENCTISGCSQTGSVRGAERVGGVAGQIQMDAVIRNCCSTGAVSGGDHTGGVVGRAVFAAVENSYSFQTGLPAVGSVYADENGGTATVTGCYALSETETGEGYLTAAQFAHQSSFAGWDFESVWDLSNGVRPVLRSNPEAIGDAVFADVSEADWFSAAVRYAVQKGYFLGAGEGMFRPADPMTRGMFLTVLARMAGETIEGADWQSRAVAWAVTNGVSDGSDPDAPITREQIVTMLWRLCGRPEGRADLSGFADAGEISDWASEAMGWAVSVGLVQGRGDGILAPGAEAKRTEAAQIIMNSDKKWN